MGKIWDFCPTVISVFKIIPKYGVFRGKMSEKKY